MKGIVKWFNKEKSYGFILPEDNTKINVFVHSRDIQDKSQALIEGQHVEFDVDEGPRGPKARNVKVVPK